MDYQKKQEGRKKYGSVFIGNVIRITDNRTIIVNIGKEHLNAGDKIQVYEPGELLTDIDGKELDNFYYIKDELEVIRAEEQYSICRKMDYVNRTFTFALSPLLEKNIKEYLPLNINQDDIQELKPKDPIIKIGDPIKLA